MTRRTLRLSLLAITISVPAFVRADGDYRSFDTEGPESRSGHTLSGVYMFGGRSDEGDVFDELWEFGFDGETGFDPEWNEVPFIDPWPAGRWGHVSWVSDRYLYIAGGRGADSQFIPDAWRFDTVARTWQEIEFYPGPHQVAGGAASHDNNGYLFATEDGAIHTYDEETNQWETLLPDSGPTQRSHSTVVQNIPPGPANGQQPLQNGNSSKAWVIGGANASGISSEVWEFDFATQSWTRRADLPVALSSLAGAYDDQRDRVLVFGGVSPEGFSRATWEYDPATDSWTRRLDLPEALVLSGATATGEGGTIIFGGRRSDQTASGRTLAYRSGETLYMAQFGNGQGFTSDIVLANPTADQTASGTISFAGNEGLPLEVTIVGDTGSASAHRIIPLQAGSEVEFSIPPRASITLSTDGQGDLVEGSARVLSNLRLGGVIRFSIPAIGIAGVGASPPMDGFIVPVRRQAGGINTGLAIFSREVRPVTLVLTLYSDGQQIATTTIEDFVARAHLARFIDGLFPEVDTTDFVGTVVVEVIDGQVTATALELGRQPGQFTTLPVTPLEPSPSS